MAGTVTVFSDSGLVVDAEFGGELDVCVGFGERPDLEIENLHPRSHCPLPTVNLSTIPRIFVRSPVDPRRRTEPS